MLNKMRKVLICKKDRFLIIGISDMGNVLLVCHCIRNEDVVRIISARKATNNEEKLYNKNIIEDGGN